MDTGICPICDNPTNGSNLLCDPHSRGHTIDWLANNCTYKGRSGPYGLMLWVNDQILLTLPLCPLCAIRFDATLDYVCEDCRSSGRLLI